MDFSSAALQLLTEIRDNQRKQIEVYASTTRQSLELQQRAVERQNEAVDRQKKITDVYFRSLFVGAGLLIGAIVLLAYLLGLI